MKTKTDKLDNVQARLASLREPHKEVISRKGTMLQSAAAEELRPFFGRTLLLFAEGATIGRGV